MTKLNKVWHEAHPMDKNPTTEERLTWHIEHTLHCACRPIPTPLLNIMQERGIAVPEHGKWTQTTE
jgi:hypothetical protein